MPEGAQSRDLENLVQFRRYLAAHVEDWYRFANGPRGRDAKNGDIRLVIGYDRAPSWGMATLRNMSQQTDCQLEFKATQDQPNAVNLATSPYTWEHSGFAEARAGPSITESTQLIQDDLNPPADGKYSNQCLFVRTLNATVNSEIWSKLCQELDTPYLDDLSSSRHGVDDSTKKSSSSKAPPRSKSFSNRSQGNQRSSAHESDYDISIFYPIEGVSVHSPVQAMVSTWTWYII